MSYALEVYVNNQLIFYSNGRWLYPLFELEQFLRGQTYDPATLFLQDKIIGRAAALLIVYLGFKRVRAGMLSTRGRAVLEHFNIDFQYDQLVERILCKTEDILQHELDPEAAYRLLKERADRTGARTVQHQVK